MQTKNIISVAAAVASFAGAAFAGTPVKVVAPAPVPPVPTVSPWSGDLYAGYASQLHLPRHRGIPRLGGRG